MQVYFFGPDLGTTTRFSSKWVVSNKHSSGQVSFQRNNVANDEFIQNHNCQNQVQESVWKKIGRILTIREL